jgi:hypothetical protein
MLNFSSGSRQFQRHPKKNWHTRRRPPFPP